MRILLIPAVALLAQASAAAPPAQQAPAPALGKAGALLQKQCRKPTSHEADVGSAWRGGPMTPKKLTELPPATSYKAVYRVVNGCEEPLTVAEYQRSVQR